MIGAAASPFSLGHTRLISFNCVRNLCVIFMWPLLLLLPLVTGRYAKPPCDREESLATLEGRSLCVSDCDADASCPQEKPQGAFAKPKCMLVRAPLGDTSHPEMRRRYCALECQGDSYCPSGSKCSLLDVTSETDRWGEVNLVARNYPHLISKDELKGVCTYRLKTGKGSASSLEPVEPLELRFSKSVTLEILQERGIRPPPGWSHTDL